MKEYKFTKKEMDYPQFAAELDLTSFRGIRTKGKDLFVMFEKNLTQAEEADLENIFNTHVPQEIAVPKPIDQEKLKQILIDKNIIIKKEDIE